jgi:hypothetical protein
MQPWKKTERTRNYHLHHQDHDDDVEDLVCVRSPENTHQLLRTTVNALQDAHVEQQESAWQWAHSMKDSVTKWVDQ